MNIGDCFKIQTSYGDNRPSWFVYRRVRKVIAGYAECHRFESRCDGTHVMYLQDPIRIDMLAMQSSIDEDEWLRAWTQWTLDAMAPWNVE